MFLFNSLSGGILLPHLARRLHQDCEGAGQGSAQRIPQVLHVCLRQGNWSIVLWRGFRNFVSVIFLLSASDLEWICLRVLSHNFIIWLLN